ncbi:glutamyl aminopeptidase isoform X2 [Nematostella vectensis]|uniref:glutamyl aminopeptidase isoform X2 n=1 Tax=Nematostella vectensis TaxID=45351 RepID=UPI0013904CE8|nr:glutamyl aminopeptidase isoform X2 [Nematostella vectensis]
MEESFKPENELLKTSSKQPKSFWSGVFLSRVKLIALAIVMLILVVIIIILAALLGKASSRLHKAPVESSTEEPTRPAGPATPGTEAWWNVRLPYGVIPVHYNLFLNVTLDRDHFHGKVDIYINVFKATKIIIVHNRRLNVSDIDIRKTGSQGSLGIRQHFPFKKNQFYVMEAEQSLEPSLYVVSISYKGFYSKGLRGFYRSSFTQNNGQRVYFVATQFEPVKAREAFPCFDEPGMKATFNITIAHRPDYVALSNMPIYQSKIIDGQRHDYFEQSVVMSTYLVAFTVGDFYYKETVTENNVKMRVYSRREALDTTEYAIRVGRDVLKLFDQYYDMGYSLTKLDMIGLPEFGPGAMENWGLIKYRESYLLWNKESSEDAKYNVARIIAHELAHQWFGNIVTMAWWDDLWLNEAFATLMAYKGADAAEPSWHVDQHFLVDTVEVAMTLDGLASSHPIRVPVISPDEIGEIFDAISYSKGATVLRMLEYIIGNDTFIDGLRRYLKTHAYGNANTDDLWESFRQASCTRGSCVDVKYIMDTWTLQMGYPVVMIKKAKDKTPSFAVTQKHFLFDPMANVSASKYKSPYNYKWMIPFTYVTDQQLQAQNRWMDRNSTTITSSGSTWIKGNHGNLGFYLVNYEDDNWDALADQLRTNHTVLGVADRAGLLFNAFKLAMGSQLNYTKAFAITEFLRKEDSYMCWGVVGTAAKYLKMVLPQSSKAYVYLKKYLVHQGEPQYRKLGFNDEGGHGELIPPNLRRLVYSQGVANGGEKEWNFLFDQLSKNPSASDQRRMIVGLAATKQSWLLARYLNYALDPLKIKQSLMRFAIEAVAEHPTGRTIAWDFVRMNWDVLVEKYSGSMASTYSQTVKHVSQGFATEFELQELIAFNEKITAASGFQSKAQIQAVEKVKSNIAWLEANQETVGNWLEGFITKNNIK